MAAKLYRDAREEMLRSHLTMIQGELLSDAPDLDKARLLVERALITDDRLMRRMRREGCLLSPTDPANRNGCF